MTIEFFDADAARRIYTVAELNRAIQAALQGAFPGAVWVRGEVQRLPADAARRNHVYFELHESSGGEAAGFQIPVALLQWDRDRFQLGRYLDGSDPDFTLHNKLEVCLECRVDFYPPYGKLSLKLVGIDKSYTLGQLEVRRQEVLAFLKQADLLERNARVPWPLLPLRVGLITAAGSAAEKDFRTGLDGSPYRFQIEMVPCAMSGEQMAGQVARALSRLVGQGVDVIVVTRGGGSRGDLSWFDQKGIAVAIANAPVPVITAIGHEVDRSIADVVAKQACKTPTAAAELLVQRVDQVARRLRDAAGRLQDSVLGQLEQARLRLAVAAQLGLLTGAQLKGRTDQLRILGGRLEALMVRRVTTGADGLTRKRGRLTLAALQMLAKAAVSRRDQRRRLLHESQRVRTAGIENLKQLEHRLAPARLLVAWPRRRRQLASCEGRLERLAAARLSSASSHLGHLQGQARLLDPERLLGRGYTLTQDVCGKLIKSATQICVGDRLRTRFHDGQVESIVARAAGEPDARKGEKRGGKKASPSQETLFR